MVTIRRKFRSFTVTTGKDRYIARRRTDSFQIRNEQVSVSVAFDAKVILHITGSRNGKIRVLPSKLTTFQILEVTLEENVYYLWIARGGNSFMEDRYGRKISFYDNEKRQSIKEKLNPLDLTILYAVYILFTEYHAE